LTVLDTNIQYTNDRANKAPEMLKDYNLFTVVFFKQLLAYGRRTKTDHNSSPWALRALGS